MLFGMKKLEWWLPDGEKFLMICLFVLTIQYNTNKFLTRPTCQFASESEALAQLAQLTQLTNVTDRHTDRQTQRHHMTTQTYRHRHTDTA